MTHAAALGGRRVVVARPADESAALARRIEDAGGEALVYPAIEIGPPPDLAALERILASLASFQLAIFVSPTAVARAFEHIAAWPPGLDAACVGPGTAKALRRHGVTKAIVPADSHDSEGLLRHPRLARVAGERVLIVRGHGGREALASGLRSRGAIVTYAECYERRKPAWDAAPLLDRLRRHTIDAMVITSSEGLRNVLAAIGPEAVGLLAPVTVIVPHRRIEADARALGLSRVVLADGAGDDSVMAVLGAAG